jgi:hypothetical protein
VDILVLQYTDTNVSRNKSTSKFIYTHVDYYLEFILGALDFCLAQSPENLRPALHSRLPVPALAPLLNSKEKNSIIMKQRPGLQPPFQGKKLIPYN